MFEFSLCDSHNCPEKQTCMRSLVEEKYCYNPVKVNLSNHLCTSKNNYNLKISSSCQLPIIKGGELLDGE